MKDMYIDYGGDRRRKEKRKKATIIIAVLALLIGVGGFFGTQYYFKMMDAQNAEATPDDTPISVAEAMDADEANPQTGVYGFWYSPKENEEEVAPTGYADLDEDVWMADFVDT
ncbi:MAG: hypothetical protein IK071_08270, partial [Lachnospiraceae bacterium]|nr:hypothetical protein [Lachnospiraceae bacterium]